MKNLFRPNQRFTCWLGRLALVAMLALVVMPTAGRLYAGGADDAPAGTAVDGAGHGASAHADHADHNAPRPAEPSGSDAPAVPGDRHAGHGDCPYCPLLASLAGTAHRLPLVVDAPAGPAPSVTVAIGHAGLRPHGLHARGPPRPA